MILMARPLVGAIGEITLWVGAFDTVDPPLPTFTLDRVETAALGNPQFFPVRDRQMKVDPANARARKPCNYQGVFRLPSANSDKLHDIVVRCEDQSCPLQVLSLPDKVPDKTAGRFTILLASCYSQPEDPGFLSEVIKNLPIRPNITLLAGDQGYLDLPLMEDIPESEPAMSNMLGDKYKNHWLSGQYGTRGLHPLFSAAPTACIPDDHEYWNNYPFAQAQLPGTHTQSGRDLWGAAARVLYEDFQLGGDPATHQGWQTIDIDPLHMLLLDTRSDRQANFNARYGLMTQDTENALVDWANQLMNAHGRGETAIGVLVTGQSLLTEAASTPQIMDAEYPNFDRQYRLILSELDRLASAGIPVVCLTGDVHWSRVTQVHHFPTQSNPLTEVICSPSSLFELPGYDQLSAAKNYISSLFNGKDDDWLRFPSPEKPPKQLLNGPFSPGSGVTQGFKGNMVSLLTFCQAGSGVEMTVTFYPLHDDPRIKRPQPAGTIKLIPNA
ncbi:hypothetical protein [Pseudomonas moorei]|uniref:hypothetical protein n=1 Tax=Pseudomonas moorei TaxID=395599 RepID=UPI00200CE8A0|nr:hypothetical protein [Pseudomonas moorei]